jgi:two-component system response regulator HydG
MTFSKLRHFKTLLIDDDEFVRDSLRLMFESRNCPLSTVETAEEAIEILSGQDYDIIITDYKLPGMDGIELCRRLRKTHPHLMKILITAYGSAAVTGAARSIGIDELIEKPITSEAFEASLSRLFTRTG